jgi:hypothetical protein
MGDVFSCARSGSRGRETYQSASQPSTKINHETHGKRIETEIFFSPCCARGALRERRLWSTRGASQQKAAKHMDLSVIELGGERFFVRRWRRC